MWQLRYYWIWTQLEVDNILCKETVESGIDFVYKCGDNFNKSAIAHE